MRHLSTLRSAVRAATPALALGTAAVTAALAACSDGPTAPASPVAGGAAYVTSPTTSTATISAPSSTVSQTTAGDTVVTTFVVGNNNTQLASFSLGTGSKVTFPYAVASICDPATASYGPTTWDAPCTAATRPITITAKTWIDATTGKPASEFQPALRFVPKLKQPVRLYLKDPNYTPREVISYCPASGTCVNEGASDPTLNTVYDAGQQWVYRIIKHFSGYTVLVG